MLAAEVVLTGPDGVRRPPVRMSKVADGHPDVPDRYLAWVTPDLEGEWTFEIQAWSDPLSTWAHDAGIKIPAGIDVGLMFTEVRLLLEGVREELPTGTPARLRQRRHRRRRRRREAGRRPAGRPRLR